MLVDSYIRRKRWEWREEAIARMGVQAEAMGGNKTSSTPAPANNGQFRGDVGGINYGPPPLAELAMLGFDMDM